MQTIEQAAEAVTSRSKEMASKVRDLADVLFYALPRDFRAEGIGFVTEKSSVGECDFLVWDNDGETVYLEEQPHRGINGGRYLHRDFNAWIPAPTYGQLRAFAVAVQGGLLDRVRAALEAQAKKDAALTESLPTEF